MAGCFPLPGATGSRDRLKDACRNMKQFFKYYPMVLLTATSDKKLDLVGDSQGPAAVMSRIILTPRPVNHYSKHYLLTKGKFRRKSITNLHHRPPAKRKKKAIRSTGRRRSSVSLKVTSGTTENDEESTFVVSNSRITQFLSVMALSMMLLYLPAIWYAAVAPLTAGSPASKVLDPVINLNELEAALANNSIFENELNVTGVMDFSDEDWDKWEAPKNFSKRYVYYLSGFDEDGRPLWVAEWGRWNIRKAVEDGDSAIYEKYFRQIAYRALTLAKKTATDDFPQGESSIIIDLDKFDITHLLHVETVSLILRLARQYRVLLTEHLNTCIIINANFAATAGFRLVRPIFADFLDRVEMFGTNKAQWLPVLTSRFPRTSLPPWYGGYKNRDYKPVKVYG